MVENGDVCSAISTRNTTCERRKKYATKEQEISETNT